MERPQRGSTASPDTSSGDTLETASSSAGQSSVFGIDVPAVSDDDHQRVVELAGLAELRKSVADAFSTLPPEQREALRLRVIDEHEYRDVAAALGVSEETARARVSRALRRIADVIDIPTPTGVNS